MDIESYIGKEKQLISRLEREHAAANVYEKRGDQGNLDLAEDEIKLLRTGLYLKAHTEAANSAVKALDERIARLMESEERAEKKNAELMLRIIDWERSFDSSYKELMGRVETSMKTLEDRNREFIKATKEQEDAFKARNMELTKKIEEAEKRLDETGGIARTELSQLVASIKSAQSDFESSINEKLEQDKQTIDKIKYMLSTMSDIIKM
ncbi:hypothetical protein CUJ83_13295 [Methanocella sp. CWC-04]|uniref:Uncharacterized protein n=1 Tax=Methanooceanicella nereidis TaxID=2052831 RepID=A0AAP2RF82_9EURY|nr:hypothetical protein [Methanocella sp. CWC-04]MCD1295972.1 hypothetical protein [Methanocella sp. CWC-04]